jgi:biopolymer transport protein ExbD
MRLRRFHAHHESGRINVTPLIDVVMCLIVFFLIVGKLAHDQRIRIDLPESSTGIAEKTGDVLIINVVSGGPSGGTVLPSAGFRVIIDAAEVPMQSLELAIREKLAARPDAVVELRGSRQLPYGSVAQVIRACKNAGIASVRLATERGPGAAPAAELLHGGPN